MNPALPSRAAKWALNVGEPVAGLDSSATATQWAALTTEGKAVVGDVATGRILQEWTAHKNGGFQLAWNPRAEWVATSGADGQVRLWNPSTARLELEFAGGKAWVELLQWSPDGEHLAVGAGKQLTLWSRTGGFLHMSNHRSTLSALCWRKDGRQLGVACYGGVQVYDPATGAVLYRLPWPTSLLSLAWSPDYRWVAAGTQDSSVQIWPQPFQLGEELAMSGYPAKVRALAWHPSGRYLATGGGEAVMVWDCAGAGPAGTTPRILEGHTSLISALAYQAQGHLFASAGADGRVLFWNANKPLALREIGLPGPLTILNWLRNDQAVLAGGQDGTIALAKAPIT